MSSNLLRNGAAALNRITLVTARHKLLIRPDMWPDEKYFAKPFIRYCTNTVNKKHVWSKEWDRLSFGATPPWQHSDHIMNKVLFVQTGFGCDQHGSRDADGATKAAVRACRNAIEFNSIPCMSEIVPGGRPNMKIKIKLGVPPGLLNQVDLGAVCAVFPYGKILPIDVVAGGLTFESGRVVKELGDEGDLAVIAVAAITVGY